MSDYKRMVAYMYGYLNRTKQNNVGYARIEIRNGQCKITMNIKVTDNSKTELPVYLFLRDGNQPKCILIGEMNVKNGLGEARLTLVEKDINDSGYGFSRMGGMIVFVSEGKYYGTEWDDIPISINTVEILGEKVNSDHAEETKDLAGENKIEDMVQEDDTSTEKEDAVQAAVSLEVAEETQTLESVETQEEIQGTENVKATVYNLDLASKIFERYPHMYPFTGEQVIDCVKIEPQDLGNFPMEMWVLGNNSFLLHGYYSYRHLIFAKIQVDGVVKHIFGVPGTYQQRETYMAKMFGFPNFMNIRSNQPEMGAFGYYYMDLPFIS